MPQKVTHPRKFRLQTLLLLINALIIIVLVMVMSLVSYWNSRQMVLDRAFQFQNQQMNQMRDYLGFYMEEAENVALTISENPEITGAFLKDKPINFIEQREERYRLFNLLSSSANSRPYIHSINLLNKDYDIVSQHRINDLYLEASVDPQLANRTFLSANSGWLSAFGGAFLRFDSTDNSKYLHYYQNIYYRSGATRIATVVVSIDPDRLMDYAARNIGGDRGELLLLDEQGRTLYDSTDPQAGGKLYDGPVQQTAEPDSRLDSLIFVRTLPETGWQVVYRQDVSVITEGTGEILGTMALIGLAILLVSIPLTALFSWRIARPVENLVRDMKKADKQGFVQREENTAILELDTLWSMYSELLGRIRDLIAAIHTEQEEKRRAQFQLLQAQINPHFIYNSIELIGWMARRHDVPEINDVVFHLGRMLRTGLNRGEEILSIDRELQHVESYLMLQRYKYENSFSVEWDIEDAVRQGFTVKLILQPLVENSIYHGLSGLQREGHIRITARRCAKDVVFTVEDNGRGMEEAERRQVLEKDSLGYGVHNIEERIRLWFGAGYGLTYYEAESGGAGVRVRIPFVQSAEELREESNDLSGIFD